MTDSEGPGTRWAREQEVFHAARALPEGERAAFVAQACAGDPGLHRAVTALLAADAGEIGVPPEPASGVLRAGMRLGPYAVGRELGRGGMGVVHAAEDTRLGRPVALKTLRAWAGLDPDLRRRLEREAQLTARLTHPYACQLFDVLEHAGVPVVVLERLEGRSLAAALDADGPFPVGTALRLAREAAEALAEAHRLGILHRDLKPSNLFLTHAGHLKVLDFGIARPLDPAEGQETLTASGVLIGTPGYCSPEQAAGESLDARSDIFALGVVLCELLTGVNPFRSSLGQPDLRRLFGPESPPLPALPAEAPAGLVPLLARLLHPAREARPATMREVVRALQALEGEGRAVVAPPMEAPPVRYAQASGGVAIAYQVFGEGPDLVYVPGWITHLEQGWTEPRVAGFFRGLARFSRVLLFDKRGTGMSDRTVGYPTLEDRMDDVRAVMDAAGSDRAVVLGMSEGGNMCMTFAASHPERVRGLITFGVFAKRVWSPDYPWAPTPEARAGWFATLEREWGGPVDLDVLAPSLAGDSEFQAWWARYLRSGASPGAALELARSNTQIDVRHVLGSIHVPTLVLHRTGDRDVHLEEGRYLADRIPGARVVALPGEDHLMYAGDQAALLGEIEAFVGALGDTPMPEEQLLTVLALRGTGDETGLGALCEEQARHFRGEPLRWRDGCWVALFDGPARAIRCALTAGAVAAGRDLVLAGGVETGPCVRQAGSIRGQAIDAAVAMARRAEAGTVLVGGSTRAMVPGAGLSFTPAGDAWRAQLGG